MKYVSKVQGKIIIAGGGVKNRAVMYEMRALRGEDVISAHDFGIESEYREAAEMAVLEAFCRVMVPSTLPAVTGVSNLRPLQTNKSAFHPNRCHQIL